uniref:ribonuclease H n=1 Tax=Xiphophorus maculatus TaxID=8083 RepID=A0A3B5R643_XIPMA
MEVPQLHQVHRGTRTSHLHQPMRKTPRKRSSAASLRSSWSKRPGTGPCDEVWSPGFIPEPTARRGGIHYHLRRPQRPANDCGDLGPKFVHHIEGGVHPPVRQYPLNPGAVEEMDKIVKELGALEIIREELNPITNSPIQAVKKPESAGGGWRPVINFKALNRRTIANRASLINPQGALKTLRVKKFKSCIDLANGFFSLRLARQSQGKTAFTHKGKSYVWQRLPQGYKNSPNVFQSAVMEVLGDVGATVYIDDFLKMTLQKLTNVSQKEFLRALMTPAGGKPTHRHVVTSGKLGTLFTPPGGTTALTLTKHLLLSGLCGPGMKITLEIGTTSGGDSNKMSLKLG